MFWENLNELKIIYFKIEAIKRERLSGIVIRVLLNFLTFSINFYGFWLGIIGLYRPIKSFRVTHKIYMET